MFKIFISYSQNDKTTAELIEGVMRSYNLETFRDEKQINWGEVVLESINNNLLDSDAILVLVSHESLKSQWVPYEIGYATALGKPILTYLVNPCVSLPPYISRNIYMKSVEDLK